MCLRLINNVKLADGINNYKKNKLSIEKNKTESNKNLKEEISSLATEFEEGETSFSSDKKDTFYFKKTLVSENKENNEIN